MSYHLVAARDVITAPSDLDPKELERLITELRAELDRLGDCAAKRFGQKIVEYWIENSSEAQRKV